MSIPFLGMKTEQSTSLKKWFRPCIETDLRRLYSHTRALTCSGGLLTGGGGLALGEEVEVLLWVRRQTPWDKLHVTFLTLYSSRVSSTVTCGNDGHYFSFDIIQLVTLHQSRSLTSFHLVGFNFCGN